MIMYRINFYVPETNLAEVKNAMFQAGAGKIGNYEKCCWQVKGIGQFLPLENSHPAIGEIGQIKSLIEYKVEMVCENENIKSVIAALIQSHPYEEPAYDVMKILTKEDV